MRSLGSVSPQPHPALGPAHLQSDVQRRGGQRKAQHSGAEAQLAAGAQRGVVLAAQHAQQVQGSAQHLVGAEGSSQVNCVHMWAVQHSLRGMFNTAC